MAAGFVPPPLYPSNWLQWAQGVLQGIGAPVNSTNLSTLWNWSHAESGSDVMRWNNPLNTTQGEPGATNMNSVGVKGFQSVQDGINATIQTLENGNYPNIVKNLRSALPQASWGSAIRDLGTWGTGAGWLGKNIGGEGATPLTTTNAPSPGFDPFGIGSALGNFATAVKNDLARAGWVLAGLVLIVIGLALLIVPEFLKKAPNPAQVPLKVLKGGVEEPAAAAAEGAA